MTYKFELNSRYVSDFHGGHLKNVGKCQDDVNPYGNGKHNNTSIGAAPKHFEIKGLLEVCTDPKINGESITMKKIEKVISTQELIDYDNGDKDVIVADHLYREGQAIKSEICIAGRSSEIRPAYLEKYGSGCKLCGKSYLKADGTSYIIDIHHLKPIANGERKTDIDKDLKGLCPNCHRFVHSIKDFENKSGDQIIDEYRKTH